jgi:HAE1 family hydrophobic/amphiphilic exporter-1
MNISKIAIERPIGVFILIIVILVLGYISGTRLGIDFLPDFTYPACSVITSYSGVAPEEIEKMVTKPIESAVSTVPNVKKVYSRSEEGVSIVIVEFNWGTNMDFAAQDIRDELDFTKRFLPEDAEKPIVVKFNPNMMPVMMIGFYSKRNLIELQEYIEDVIQPQLERLDGVAAAFVFGEAKKEVSILLDRNKMEQYFIPISQVIQTLRLENIDTSAGKVESTYTEYLVRAKGEFKSVDEIKNLVISNRGGTPIYLKDIAQIKLGMKELTSYARTENLHAIPIGIQKLSGTNTVLVAERVKKKLKEIEKTFPKDIKYRILMDQSEYIKDSINNLFSNLWQGGLLAVIVVFLFLGSIRSTLVIALSIPISIIATLIPMYFQNFTINTMSLGGLAIAIGMLVDNSIVVLENIFRHMQKGEEPDIAGEKGSSEVISAITAATLTTICVFLPVAFITGITSIIFSQLGWTVTYSLLFSLILAITLVPMLTAKIVRVPKEDIREDTLFYRTRNWYGRLVEKSLNNRWKILFAVFSLFIISIFLFSKVSKEFMAESGEKTFLIDLEMKKGTKLDVTDRVTRKVENIVRKLPFVEYVGVRVGIPEEMAGFMAAMGGRDEGPNTSIVFVRLKPSNKRKGITTTDAIEITREKIEKVKGVNKNIRTMMQLTGMIGEKLVIKIIGDDIGKLLYLSDKITEEIKDIPGVTDLTKSITLGRPHIEIHYDRDKLSSYGLNAGMVGNILTSSLKGTVASFYRTGDEEIDIRVRLDEKYRKNIKDIENILIPTPAGFQIKLSDVADVKYTLGPTKLERDNKRRFMKITGNVVNRPLGDAVEDIKEKISKMKLPKGYFIEFGGEYETMQETFKNLLFALILAIFLVYAVMALQFESLLNPFIIIFTIPLAIIGVVFAFLITGQTLSLTSYLGIIMLMGVVVNNAIVMVDFINQLKRSGIGRKQAIIEGAKLRLRPVLMTSITTIIGMLPLALGIGEGAEVRQPMGISFIGGMITSTFLTLIIIPIVYSILDPIGENLRKKILGENNL